MLKSLFHFSAMMVAVLGLAISFSNADAAETAGASAISCTPTDVTYAQKYYDATAKGVKEGVEQPIQLSRAAVLLAETQHCAGQATLEDFCTQVNSHLANLQAMIAAMTAEMPADVGTMKWYLQTKLYYAGLCTK